MHKKAKIFLKMAKSNLICHLYTVSLSAQAFISAAGNMSMCKDGIKPLKDVLSNKLNGRISRNLSRICHSEIKHKKKAFRFSSKKMTAIFRTINMFCSDIFRGLRRHRGEYSNYCLIEICVKQKYNIKLQNLKYRI